MGAGGGKTSTSSGTSTSSSPYAPMMAQFTKASLPIFKDLSSQIGEALRSGGVNAQIPLINRSVDASREASSTSMESTRQALARAGLGGSSFATRILGDQGNQSGQQIAGIPSSIAGNFISMAPALTGEGIKAGYVATGADSTTNTSSQSTPSFWDFFNQGLGSGASLGAGLYA